MSAAGRLRGLFLQQVFSLGERYGLGPVGYAEFLEDRGELLFDGVDGRVVLLDNVDVAESARAGA